MKAIQLQETDGIEALAYDDVPRPEPERDELLIRVHAAGINPIDWLTCRGQLPHLLDSEVPWTPGWDVSGVVESVGNNVTEFAPGDVVCGMARLPGSGGAFAEFITVTSDEITAKPGSLSHLEAAGVPMAGQTAFHALYEEGNLDSGQHVLIHAAAGGVGHMAVQFAANTGAYVIGTASGRNEAFLHELGVDEFINYREERFEDVLDDVDLVLDAVGGDVLERSVEVVQPGGVVVTLPEPPLEKAVERYHDEYNVAVRFFDVIMDSDPVALRQVAAHVESGVVAPLVSDTYPLFEVQNALDRNADGHVRGKLVVDITEGTDD
ncbi:Zn-dependent oxidoreductase, NADPH:quinone reductase [Halovivax asiaticus JCM 14624]|uniref:Zn-dependent oxidoreductase, NADPH:quinone reductase n=1 Tax=Halovivax asiaticus JCM 14624 TaxID=1227490 RepID=M0BR89_9EURY|nr:NADP-dependent oxidoreductase [Halovivax asiaticus]ELZ12209.1 Zn-dependent oxidoreductase, NADPH:quinone reductase [Halovivax asiaticus JCM 14624]